MITKDTHSIDWNKTAQVTGVVLLALAKGTWWLTKHAGLLLLAVLIVLAKVFVALVSVWASIAPTAEEETEANESAPAFGYNHLGEWVEGGFYSVPPNEK